MLPCASVHFECKFLARCSTTTTLALTTMNAWPGRGHSITCFLRLLPVATVVSVLPSSDTYTCVWRTQVSFRLSGLCTPVGPGRCSLPGTQLEHSQRRSTSYSRQSKQQLGRCLSCCFPCILAHQVSIRCYCFDCFRSLLALRAKHCEISSQAVMVTSIARSDDTGAG